MKLSVITCLLLGLVSIDQIDNVSAVQLLNTHHKRRKHKHQQHHKLIEPQWNLQTQYDSPFGLDSKHGYGGMDQKKVESAIDLGQIVSDGDEEDDEIDLPEAQSAMPPQLMAQQEADPA